MPTTMSAYVSQERAIAPTPWPKSVANALASAAMTASARPVAMPRNSARRDRVARTPRPMVTTRRAPTTPMVSSQTAGAGAVVDVDAGCDHDHEDRQTDRHAGHRSPLRPGQGVVNEQAVDGQREDDRRHQDRLHHHQGAGGQRAEHEEEPDQVAADAEQPPRVAGQAGQQPEAHGHVGRGSGRAVLEGHAGTKHRRRQHGEHERRRPDPSPAAYEARTGRAAPKPTVGSNRWGAFPVPGGR